MIQVPIRLHRQSFYVCLRLDPLLSCQTPRVFAEHLGGAFAPPPLMALPTDSSSDAGKRPTAYQSVSNYSACLQASSPSDLPGLPFPLPEGNGSSEPQLAKQSTTTAELGRTILQRPCQLIRVANLPKSRGLLFGRFSSLRSRALARTRYCVYSDGAWRTSPERSFARRSNRSVNDSCSNRLGFSSNLRRKSLLVTRKVPRPSQSAFPRVAT